ncbi:alpha-glucan family phosphorylase [Nitrosomonas ureae]|uniref:Starch phosphorylase n=1 Tax=Nitrosomonas ureae TaxID=44577 RepID=A0A1H2H2L3_9PROT|nr:alpha-glucan family phosphorylase [Nitrosomonas ureae]ALQ52226.1 alpha-glucan phosphorylase [Nitrosomonas ureae]SDU26094.1 starch phosphorylase [Nitrosomonas ureae]
MFTRTAFTITVNPKIPHRLKRLEELANNLWYSWDRATRTLFSRLDPHLWEAVGHNPKAFLKRVDESVLIKATKDRVFLATYNSILSTYDSYHDASAVPINEELDLQDQIAYFCFEFGFHESLPIYSGGLGILAGDHCKAASDLHLPFVAIGLLYRQGYFSQTIDSLGNQQVAYTISDFDDLPVTPVLREDGSSLQITVPLSQRDITIKVWQAKIGHVTLFLLDTDLLENSPQDRYITHNLYGGDKVMRIEQEIILGMGGVRVLQALGIKPTIWHINEGHAAFMILERIYALVQQGLDFASALESVAVNTVFTTHTAVPAGHDHFDANLIQTYFDSFYRHLNITREEFMALGHAPGSPDFNMTALAIHGSRTHNGVSKIHGDVSANICRDLWPQIEPEENPISYITNGVHVPTFLAQEWSDLFDRYLGHEWRNKMCDTDYWSSIDAIPDHLFWSVRQSLKSQMFYGIRSRISEQNSRNRGSEAHLDRLLKFVDPINPNILTLGFARRFATYKRAALLFDNLDWLRNIIFDQDRPVLLLFAGKAHPADVPGQDLIRRISQIASLPEFEGRLLLIEGYDLRLARRLVAGVDVWLNNPIYPLEASGTSGMKAGINGAINLSVLDGWWGEGYDGKNGWAIKPGPEDMEGTLRDQEEGRALYEILQDQVIPLYYDYGKLGYSPNWVKMAKHSMISLLPRYNATRMVDEYVTKFYRPASRKGMLYAANDFAAAKNVAVWKTKIKHAWQGITLRRLDTPCERIHFNEALNFKVAANLNGLSPEDVVIELLICRQFKTTKLCNFKHFKFEFTGTQDSHEHSFELKLIPELCGKQEYFIRIYPYHSLLSHPLEMGLMVWL